MATEESKTSAASFEVIKNKVKLMLMNELMSNDIEDVLLDCDDGEKEIRAVLAAESVFNKERITWHRIQRYYEDTVPLLHDKIFQKHFRMSRTSFEDLCKRLSTSKEFIKKNRGGRPMITFDKQVIFLKILFYLL